MKSEEHAGRIIRFEHRYRDGRADKEERYVVARYRLTPSVKDSVAASTKAQAFKSAKKLIDHEDVIGFWGVERMNAAKARGAKQLNSRQMSDIRGAYRR